MVRPRVGHECNTQKPLYVAVKSAPEKKCKRRKEETTLWLENGWFDLQLTMLFYRRLEKVQDTRRLRNENASNGRGDDARATNPAEESTRLSP